MGDVVAARSAALALASAAASARAAGARAAGERDAAARAAAERDAAERDVLARALAWALLASLAEAERARHPPALDPAAAVLVARLRPLCLGAPALAARLQALEAALDPRGEAA